MQSNAIRALAVLYVTAAWAGQAMSFSQSTTETSPPPIKPRVFVSDSQSWEAGSQGGGGGGVFFSRGHAGARPQTAEIIKTFGERCPDVKVNNRQEMADYIVELDHEGGKGMLSHKNKIAVFEKASGDVVESKSTLSLGGSVEDACKAIVLHWAMHGQRLLAAKDPVPAAAAPAAVAVPAATSPARMSPVVVPDQPSAAISPDKSSTAATVEKVSIAAQPPVVSPPAKAPAPSRLAMATTLTLESTPPGGDVEVDGAFVGNTPSTVILTPGSHEITVKKKGFTPWTRKMNVLSGSVHLTAELQQEQAK
jgi:hypothetical protein